MPLQAAQTMLRDATRLCEVWGQALGRVPDPDSCAAQRLKKRLGEAEELRRLAELLVREMEVDFNDRRSS